MESGKFLVQVGYGRGAYETRYAVSTLGEAERWYAGLNVHSGYKKRLLGPDGRLVAGFRYISNGHRR